MAIEVHVKSVAPTEATVGREEESKSNEELKSELERVSKQMNDLKNECAELKRGMKNKDLEIEAKEAEIQSFKKAKVGCSSKDISSTKMDIDQSFHTPTNEALQAGGSYWTSTRKDDKLNGVMKELHSMETHKACGNTQAILNQNSPGQVSAYSTAQSGRAGDWQEETYQMIRSLKDQYFAELNELLNKISLKVQHVDSEKYGRMKSFKKMLERVLHVLQTSKGAIQPSMRDKAPQYEKQIISILNSQRKKPVQPQIQQQLLQVQMNNCKASADPAAETGHAGAGDWQEEIYQMLNSLKDQHFAELSELFNKISVKLQHVDSIIPRQMPSEQYERMESFKIMIDRILQFLQISKSTIQPSMREKIPRYEKQIISILNSQKRKTQQQFQPPAEQPPNSCISQQQQPARSLLQHDSHSNPQASLSSMGTVLQSSYTAADFWHVPVPPTTNFSVYTQHNGADIQRQAGSSTEAAQGSNFNSWQYGSMVGALQPGSTWPMQGTMNDQPKTSMLSRSSMSTMQPNANSMQENARGWTHPSGPRKHVPKRSWRDAF